MTGSKTTGSRIRSRAHQHDHSRTVAAVVRTPHAVVVGMVGVAVGKVDGGKGVLGERRVLCFVTCFLLRRTS